MKDYVGFNFTKRKTNFVDLEESMIQNGDMFGINRLDGVDTMLAWAMGSSTGHVTVALRDPATNKLYVAESTTVDVRCMILIRNDRCIGLQMVFKLHHIPCGSSSVVRPTWQWYTCHYHHQVQHHLIIKLRGIGLKRSKVKTMDSLPCCCHG